MQLPLGPGRLFRPGGVARIDPRNPLGFGLKDLFSFTEGGGIPVNLATASRTATLSATPPRWAVTPEGQGGYASGGASFSMPAPVLATDSTLGWTLWLRFLPLTWPANFTALIDTVNRQIGAFFDSNGVGDFGTTYRSTTNPSWAFPAGRVGDLVWTGVGAAPFLKTFYANGVPFGAAGSWTAGVDSDVVVLGANPSGGGVNPNVIYLMWGAWQRALTASEVLTLYIRPYDLLQFPTDDLFAELVGVTVVAGGKTPWPLFQRIAA